MVHERLLDIAIREFGARGREGVSTRALAAAAGTAMSSITYHYGGKDGLYLAAADHIAARMEDLALGTDAEGALRAGEPARAAAAVKAVLGRLIDKLAGDASEEWMLFILREQMHPSAAFDRIYAGPMGGLLATLVSLVELAAGCPAADARLVVLTLFGEVMVLRGARGTCARLTGGDCAGEGFVARFRARVERNTDAILGSLGGERA